MARRYCGQCHKAEAACICRWVFPVINHTRVVILQHPDEVKKALGTARIATLCLANVELLIGIDFSEVAAFQQLISADNHNVGLLYPSDSSRMLKDWLEYDSQSPDFFQNQFLCNDSVHMTEACPPMVNSHRTLIVLDGTWRNVREMLMSNESLKGLPYFKLQPNEKTNYRIRKAPSDKSLSTVEAISQALSLIEPSLDVGPMLHCFKKMVDYQISCMGEEVYKRNYLDRSV